MDIIVPFLLQIVTNKIIKPGPGVSTHMLQHLGVETPLETCDFLDIRVNHVRSIATQIVECM
jgi:hypothetical protein